MSRHGKTLAQLFAFMKPLNGVMAFSILMRIIKMVTATALIAVAAGSIAVYAAAPTGDTLWRIAGWLIALSAVLGVSHYLEQFSGHYLAFRILAMIRNAFYDHMEPQAPAGTLHLRSGEAISRVISDCERIEPFYAHTIAQAVCAVVVPLVLLAYLWTIHPAFTWTLTPFLIALAVVVPIIVIRLSRSGEKEWRRVQGEVNAFLTDSLQGLRDTIAFGYGPRRRKEVWALGERLKTAQGHMAGADAVQRGVVELFIAAAAIAMAWVGFRLARQGVIDPAQDIPVVLAIAITSFAAVVGVTKVISDYRVSLASAERLFTMMYRPPLIRDTANASPQSVDPSITFERVSFAYPDPDTRRHETTRVLHDVSFSVEAGRNVGLVGASGAGKSTIVNLLLRFWDPQQGEIRLGGHPLRAFRLDDLRDLISVVSQRNYIFNTTIGENIAIGKPGATPEDIITAARRAGLGPWIESLPDGLETRVGEMGSLISGGQRQRIAIARALLKNAPILVLDEPTSSLDVETEAQIKTAIADLMTGRTTMTIAHRLSTIIQCDEILVLDQGRIAERGTHSELLARKGIYARLFALQQDDVDTQIAVEG